MSNTGRYKYDPTSGRVVKVSERIPHISVFDCFCPEGGYFSENLGSFVRSRTHKRELLESQGLRETNDKLSVREV